MLEGKIINCKYWILRDEEDAKKVKEKIGGWKNLNYKYPYVVGKERAFVFQDQSIKKIEDFFDEDQNTTYKYYLQSI